MPKEALVLVAAAVLEAREKSSTYSSSRPGRQVPTIVDQVVSFTIETDDAMESCRRCRREIHERLVRRPDDDIPAAIRDEPRSRVVYGVIREFFAKDHRPEVVAMAAEALVEIVERHSIVNWTQNADVQKAMMNDMEDYLFDVVRGQYGVPLSTDVVDEIIDRTLQIARHRAEVAA
jgi:hypothetical protein